MQAKKDFPHLYNPNDANKPRPESTWFIGKEGKANIIELDVLAQNGEKQKISVILHAVSSKNIPQAYHIEASNNCEFSLET